MKSVTLSTTGTHPDICFDESSDLLCCSWQQGDQLMLARLKVGTLAVESLQNWNLGGKEGVFARVHAWMGRVWLVRRNGAAPFHGRYWALGDSASVDIGDAHGAYPFAFGSGHLAYISGPAPDYPVKVRKLLGGTDTPNRNAQGTGLSRVDLDQAGNPVVTLIDEDRNAVPGIADPAWAGPCVIGTADRKGRPCNVARLPDGREALLWWGDDSQNPRICTDGVFFFATAWGNNGSGVRVMALSDFDFVLPQEESNYAREPADIPKQTSAKWFGYYYDHGRYGEYTPEVNTTVIGLGMYVKDGVLPSDAAKRVCDAIVVTGTGFVDANSIVAAKPVWNRVAGVWLGEYDDPAAIKEDAKQARSIIKQNGLEARQIIVTLKPNQLEDPKFFGLVDVAACEFYFDAPEATPEAQERVAIARINAVADKRPEPMIIIGQCYDRSRNEWKTENGKDCLEALQYAYAVGLSRAVGFWGFAYGRTGGVLDNTYLILWHEEIFSSCGKPRIVVPKTEGEPPVAEFFTPNDAQGIDALRRIHLYYVDVLGRKQGIFAVPPDGMDVAISDPTRSDSRIDTKSLAVWGMSRYISYFNQNKGDHEKSIRQIETDLRNSAEGQAHANPQ